MKKRRRRWTRKRRRGYQNHLSHLTTFYFSATSKMFAKRSSAACTGSLSMSTLSTLKGAEESPASRTAQNFVVMSCHACPIVYNKTLLFFPDFRKLEPKHTRIHSTGVKKWLQNCQSHQKSFHTRKKKTCQQYFLPQTLLLLHERAPPDGGSNQFANDEFSSSITTYTHDTMMPLIPMIPMIPMIPNIISSRTKTLHPWRP